MANAYGLNVGDKVAGFVLPATSGDKLGTKGLKNDYLVLYFYPRDNTSGCTLEGQDFKRLYPKFQKMGAEIYGISRDSLAQHEKFKEKFAFPFELLSDEDGVVCKKFDVIQIKNMYGRKIAGIERSTFVIHNTGKILGAWRKVRVAGHAEEVLKAVLRMSKGQNDES